MKEIEANGLTFRYRDAGKGGEPVLLLHGFPVTSAMWDRMVEDLAAAGYHAIAPDQRGYSPGARPDGVNEYRYENLGGDVFALAKAFGYDRFHLVGHDWGAGAGWCALAIDPAPIQSWTALSVAHMKGFAEAVYKDPDEELYRGFLASLSDPNTAAALAADDCAVWKARAWTSSTREQVKEYAAVLSDPKAMQAAINWYVAGDMHKRLIEDPTFDLGDITTPTLLLWGKSDVYCGRMTVELAEPYMKGPYRVVELDANHWVVEQAYERCRDEILQHLKANAL